MKNKIISTLFLLASPYAFASTNELLAHPVGSCYGGGLVFYVNKEPGALIGQRGLIVALEDASDNILNWDPSGRTLVATSSRYFSGQSNTESILSTVNNQPNNGDSTWPAAEAASAYTTAETCPTCSPWYLPSQDELATLYFQSINFTNFWSNPKCSAKAPDNQLYWSSTQYGANTAWYVDFNSGRTLYYPTPGPFKVRAVRAF